MSRIKKFIISMVLFFLAISTVYSQQDPNIGLAKENDGIESILETAAIQIRNNKHFKGISDEQLKAADPQAVLSLLAPYEKDPAWTVRRLAHLYGVRLADLHPIPEVRQEVTKRLVEAIVNPDLHWSPQPYKWLLTFKAGDFNSQTKTLIRQSLMKDRHIDQKSLVLIVGVANIREELPRLKKLLIDEVAYKNDPNSFTKWYYTLGWKARLARARMGVEEDINRCIELVETEKFKGLGALNLLHDLAYIRQPATIDVLKEYVFSDERLSPVKPTAPGEPVAAYVIDILADCISNLPIKKRDGRGYKQDEIELCRKWMSEQTEWEIIR